MFKYLKYKNYNFKTDSYIYKLIDSEFEYEVSVSSNIIFDLNNLGIDFVGAEVIEASVIIISEYKRKNYSCDDIVKNLLKHILNVSVKYKYNLNKILKLQKEHMDIYIENIEFNKTYLPKLKKQVNKYKAFI